MSKIQSIRGMNDILPSQTPLWQYFERCVRDVLSQYGYQEIRMPIVEPTELFARGVGEHTDIVEKEMYTFLDRNEDSLTLRPEGTAGCVRAALQNGLMHNQIQRLWYQGPMFRYERPQKGRYRQFHQVGVEAFGLSGADIDAELILLTHRLFKKLGVSDSLTLHINTLGSYDARLAYREALVAYLVSIEAELDEDSQRRLHVNPMRILDSKSPKTQSLLDNAPVFDDFIDEESKAHFDALCQLLTDNGLPFVINKRLVRGLDYYTKTVFEWMTDALGAQGTVCGGGRYDGLVTLLGGKPAPASGFAIGIERLLLLIEALDAVPTSVNQSADVFVVAAGEQASSAGLKVAEQVRALHPNLRVQMNAGGGSFKSQMKKADKSGAKIALILGDTEIAEKQVTVKYLQSNTDQLSLSWDRLSDLVVDKIPALS